VSAVTVDNTTLARKKYLGMTDEEFGQINMILDEYRKAV
jgi:hypothetical protein